MNVLRHRKRAGRIDIAWLCFLGSIVLAGLLIMALAFDPRWLGRPALARPLVVYCAAGLRGPVAAIAEDYEREFGIEVQVQYGGSNVQLANLELSDRADLFLPADDAYTQLARKRNLIAEVLPLARMKPVLAVSKGNPHGVRSLEDLLARSIKVSQANPEAAAIGKVVRDTLVKTGQWSEFQKHIVVTKPTVNDVATDIQVGAVAAGFIWDITLSQMPGLEAVAAPEFSKVSALLSACIARQSSQPTAALHFARYLAARDRGLVHFAKGGFAVAEGDPWADEPELRILAGSMLKPAIDRTLTAFEAREGVRITRVFNGCGILVAQMKTGQSSPDAYFACDREFMDMVKDRFGPATTLSSNQLVIFVHKGNPHKIKRLRDLGKAGLRVGIGHEKQCAMGAITQETLRQDGTRDVVMKNVTVQSPTGDMLVNQMLTGSLDAVVAYISNGAGHKDTLEAIAVDVPCAVAEQPFAVGKSSEYKQLMGRLLDTLRASESRQRFEANGFGWKVKAP